MINYDEDDEFGIAYYENGEILLEEWYLNGQKDRENDLPALINYDENGEIESETWYLNDEFIRSKP